MIRLLMVHKIFSANTISLHSELKIAVTNYLGLVWEIYNIWNQQQIGKISVLKSVMSGILMMEILLNVSVS